MRKTNADIQAAIAKGWVPNQYLTNLSMAFFSDPSDFVATSIFPLCPVQLQASYYYIFNKGDLARDQVKRKPAFGKVAPAVMGTTDQTYKTEVDQVLIGIDQIAALNYQRTNVPGVIDPRRAKVRMASEQMALHLDLMFAKNFFKSGVWSNEWTGTASASDVSAANKKFLKFSDSASDPISFIDDRITEIKLRGRRKPNRLCLGVNVFNKLKKNAAILERVKYTGSTANPARVNENVLAELFGVEQVKVLESTYNSAKMGAADNMEFICDPDDMLLAYATNSPQIDEPSAGYIFTWDMLGNGAFTAFDQFEGEKGTHSEFIEGLMSTDMKKTCDDLATYFKDCV